MSETIRRHLLSAARRQRLGWKQSIRVDVVFRQIVCELLILCSAWHRSDEVFDKAIAYYFWIEKNYTKVRFRHFPSFELFCLHWLESQLSYTSQPVKYLNHREVLILKSGASVLYVTNKWRRHTLENKMCRVVLWTNKIL